MPYFSHDTIAQIGTPPGHGLTGAVRVSGPDAFAVLGSVADGLDGVLAGVLRRGAHSCRLAVELSRRRDGGPRRAVFSCPAWAYIMPGPASYTREDMAEIHAPGSPALLQAALSALVRAGARAAAPGEFTFRAFRNGRLSLGQAEAVEEVIRAADAADCRRALARLGERGKEHVRAWRDRTLELAARVEAALDFSEEELQEDVRRDLAAVAHELEREGCVLAGRTAAAADLPQVALIGNANAGKSSLFNALLGEEATLVSPRAATTRDSLRREASWHGVRFILSDNPGFHTEGSGAGGRASGGALARLGGEDVSCWVLDASLPLDETTEAFAERLQGETIVILNKSDLPRKTDAASVLRLAERHGVRIRSAVEASAATGRGVGEVRRALAEAARGAHASGQWNRREQLELSAALGHCRAAASELDGAGRLELAAEDLRAGVSAFSRALGDGYAEEALNRIFSGFCIGK